MTAARVWEVVSHVLMVAGFTLIGLGIAGTAGAFDTPPSDVGRATGFAVVEQAP